MNKQHEKAARQELFSKAGSYLKKKRLENSFSLKDIADRVGCKAQFICNIERGKAFPPMQVMRGMIEAYQIPEKEILEFLTDLQYSFFKQLYFEGGEKRARAN
jgi:transcriptional regulator with XRE-family HTH domain